MSAVIENLSLAEEFNAAVAWWRDAGVDYDFADDATDWLAPAKAAEAEKPRQSAKNGPSEVPEQVISTQRKILPETDVPADITAFQKWWLEEPALDMIGPRGRIAPRGKVGAQLMVLTLDPEAPDNDHLLSGPRGTLLSKILRATGLEENDIYFASVLPRHTPMADGQLLVEQGYAEVLKLHIKLASPAHVCAFGSHILPLLSHGAATQMTKEAGSLQEINHDNRTTPVFAADSLEGMMGSPSLKARFWRRWVKWTERFI